MSERKPEAELDGAVQDLMKHAQPSADLPADVAALVRLAERLLDLPDAGFREELKQSLLAAAGDRALQLRTITGIDPGEIRLALEEMDARSPLIAYELDGALRDLPELAMRFLARMSDCVLGVSRFSSHAHWERHRGADELLYVLDGEMDVTTLTAEGPVVSNVAKGAAFVCPRGLWHRVAPRTSVALLFATPGEGTEHAQAPQYAGTDRPGPASIVGAAHQVGRLSEQSALLAITDSTTAAEADAAFRQLFTFNECSVNVGRFRGLTPWERHRRGDELLHVLDGEVEITVLTDDGPVHQRIREGSIFVCPRGLWHRQHAEEPVTGLFATPLPSEISWAEDPRIGA